MILESIWNDLGNHFGGHFGTKSAQEEPRGPSRAPKYRKPAFAKNLKNHLFFKVFGGPRPSKTASEDPRKVPRGYLGLLEAILSHLGAILETRAFKVAPSRFACAPPPASWPILGSILGLKIGKKMFICGVIFWTSFWTLFGSLFGPLWGLFFGPILGPDWPKKGQDEQNMAI